MSVGGTGGRRDIVPPEGVNTPLTHRKGGSAPAHPSTAAVVGAVAVAALGSSDDAKGAAAVAARVPGKTTLIIRRTPAPTTGEESVDPILDEIADEDTEIGEQLDTLVRDLREKFDGISVRFNELEGDDGVLVNKLDAISGRVNSISRKLDPLTREPSCFDTLTFALSHRLPVDRTLNRTLIRSTPTFAEKVANVGLLPLRLLHDFVVGVVYNPRVATVALTAIAMFVVSLIAFPQAAVLLTYAFKLIPTLPVAATKAVVIFAEFNIFLLGVRALARFSNENLVKAYNTHVTKHNRAISFVADDAEAPYVRIGRGDRVRGGGGGGGGGGAHSPVPPYAAAAGSASAAGGEHGGEVIGVGSSAPLTLERLSAFASTTGADSPAAAERRPAAGGAADTKTAADGNGAGAASGEGGASAS